MGVGGAIDVVAGITQRAPAPLQRLGLEWAYRLAQEPRRLWRRYAVTNLQFALLLAPAGSCAGWRTNDAVAGWSVSDYCGQAEARALSLIAASSTSARSPASFGT